MTPALINSSRSTRGTTRTTAYLHKALARATRTSSSPTTDFSKRSVKNLHVPLSPVSSTHLVVEREPIVRAPDRQHALTPLPSILRCAIFDAPSRSEAQGSKTWSADSLEWRPRPWTPLNPSRDENKETPPWSINQVSRDQRRRFGLRVERSSIHDEGFKPDDQRGCLGRFDIPRGIRSNRRRSTKEGKPEIDPSRCTKQVANLRISPLSSKQRIQFHQNHIRNVEPKCSCKNLLQSSRRPSTSGPWSGSSPSSPRRDVRRWPSISPGMDP